MHFTYKQVCDEVGFSTWKNLNEPPMLEYKLVAYVSGTVVNCSDVKAWEKFKLREKIVTPESKKAYDEYWDSYKVLESEAEEHFINKLKEYFSEISPAQFVLCWSKAWEDGHSAGYDEVASYLEEYVELCLDFVAKG